MKEKDSDTEIRLDTGVKNATGKAPNQSTAHPVVLLSSTLPASPMMMHPWRTFGPIQCLAPTLPV